MKSELPSDYISEDVVVRVAFFSIVLKPWILRFLRIRLRGLVYKPLCRLWNSKILDFWSFDCHNYMTKLLCKIELHINSTLRVLRQLKARQDTSLHKKVKIQI